jgi:superfamily II DNA or RNA helicase
MRRVTVTGIDPGDVEQAVDAGAYLKGTRYARQQAVLHTEWDDEEYMLSGLVRGSAGHVYHTSVYFDPEPDGLWFDTAECSCPVGVDCKHAVALALTAAGTAGQRTDPCPNRPAVGWERSLASLLEPAGIGAADAPVGTPLAIELTVELTAATPIGHSGAAPRLLARVMRQGKTGWVSGGVSWGTLASRHHHGHRESHLRLLRELYALSQSRIGPSTFNVYRDEKTIDLAAFGSRQLWSMLDEAESIGLRVVHARKGLGALDRRGRAELCLDVTQGQRPRSWTLVPVLRVDGTDETRVPVGFVGADGHGVAHVAAGQTGADPSAWRLQLARLTRPAPPMLQRMALGGERLEIPADQRDRFRDEFYPRLRHQATIISSDGSFTPPVISDPTLVLRASYGDGHDLAVSWEWAYEVGQARMRAPLGRPGLDEGYRDPAKERSVLDTLAAPFEQFGADPERGLLPELDLRDLDTMRFTTEVLPLLVDAPGVQVERSGAPADYREAGDSLRIGVSTEEIDGETDWFDLGVSISIEGREVAFAAVFTALARDESHLLLADGAYFSLRKPELRALRTLIEEARSLRDAPDGPLRISRFQAGLWDELTELGVVDRQASAWQRQVSGLLSLASIPAPEPPMTLSATLRPYQRDGFGWLAFLWESRLGGILADDMGLGKTLQTLALICHAKQADPATAPFLILAPTSVVSNWANEAARFTLGLRVVPVQDTLRRRGQDLDQVIAGADVVVTSYTLFRLDFAAYAEADWSGLILDEAQYVKNHQSKIYQSVRRLTAPFKLAITGTPMENNLMELWSLLSITAPGLFPSPKRFREHYLLPIEKQADAERLRQLRRRIKPLVKRRTKQLVAADLPAKQEQILEVELAPRHRTIYQRHLQRERQKVLGLIDDLNRNRFTVLRSLTLLRQLSLHAGLVDADHHDLPSGKIDALLDQLREVVDGGHRALVFSQFTGFLARVRERLDDAGIPHTYLDGSTRRRDAVIREFKDGVAPVFLISLKAGGFGLNLTEADYCFLLDPWWNPATEAQAVDRTHRIGQTRNVMVYRLIAKDTIEEKVLALQTRKAALVSGVMDDGNVFGSTLGADDIRELFA